jgi:nitroreductase
MDIFEVMNTNRAVRHFKADPVPQDVLDQVLEAAVRAPNGGNSQRWHFIVLRDPEARSKVGEWYRQAYIEHYDPVASAAAAESSARARVYKSSRYLAEHMKDEPPVLILVCSDRPPGALDPGRMAGSSVYPAIQNLMLAARALGLGTCLTTIHQHNEAKIKEYLGIPDTVDTYALIPLGYPETGFGPLTRKPASEVTFYDRWGKERL